MHTLKIMTNNSFNVWHIFEVSAKTNDPARGCITSCGGSSEHFGEIDCAIIFVDWTNEDSFRSVDKWLHELPNIPVVVCATKGDITPNIGKVKWTDRPSLISVNANTGENRLKKLFDVFFFFFVSDVHSADLSRRA
jgi:hypothetical protein